MLKLIDLTIGLRVSLEQEILGADLTEHAVGDAEYVKKLHILKWNEMILNTNDLGAEQLEELSKQLFSNQTSEDVRNRLESTLLLQSIRPACGLNNTTLNDITKYSLKRKDRLEDMARENSRRSGNSTYISVFNNGSLTNTLHKTINRIFEELESKVEGPVNDNSNGSSVFNVTDGIASGISNYAFDAGISGTGKKELNSPKA